MTIETKTYGHEIFADEGKAIRHKDDPHVKTAMTSVCIPLSQDPNEWLDCEYGEDETEPSPYETTMADNDAAMNSHGVTD